MDLTTEQLLAIVIPASMLALAVFKLMLDAKTERERTQPIVIAHEMSARHFSTGSLDTGWEVDVYLTSDGERPAFNVTFGVEYGGVRIPFMMKTEDVKANRQRVIRPGDRLPDSGSWTLRIDSLTMYGIAGKKDLDSNCIYWCQYENSAGKTYETRNPGERTGDLDIQRVRWIKRVPARVWYETFKRQRARRRGEEMEKEIKADFIERKKQRDKNSTDDAS